MGQKIILGRRPELHVFDNNHMLKMQAMKPGSVCSLCISTLGRRVAPRAPIEPLLAQRFFSRQVKARPSRMVLSDRVHRSPASAEKRNSRRDSVDGPFAGMNRRFANVDRNRPSGESQSSSSSSSRRDDREASSRHHDRRTPDDRKALKMQRALATVSYGRRTSVKEKMSQYETFDQFDLLPVLKSAITQELFKNMVDIKPTPVQRLAIPALLGQSGPGETKVDSKAMESFLLAAETGSGKTLAYLLPAINALKIAEAEDPDIKAYGVRLEEEKARQQAENFKGRPFEEPHPTMARPKVVVLVPTAELAQQVMRVSKTLSHVAKFKTEMISSDLKAQQIQRNLYGPKGIDVVVATPHLLASIADSDPNILSRVSHLIVDEADSLLDRSFAPVTTSVIERAMPSMKKFVCCSATIPKKLNNYLATNYPKMVRITTPNLHAIPRRVQLGVIDVSKDPYRNNKDLACADAIYTIGREASVHEGPVKGEVDVRRVLVFVNERERTEEVAEYLRSKGIDAQALHRDTPEKRHGEVLDLFTSPEPLRITTPLPATSGRRRSLPNVKALVVTDLASRGIDTVAVRHVILYDVPHTTIDFIHRLGRAGRMGRRGRGIVLVGNNDRKDVVAEVKNSMFMGQALI
jgi:ATP-dependent RNA helicase MRH4